MTKFQKFDYDEPPEGYNWLAVDRTNPDTGGVDKIIAIAEAFKNRDYPRGLAFYINPAFENKLHYICSEDFVTHYAPIEPPPFDGLK